MYRGKRYLPWEKKRKTTLMCIRYNNEASIKMIKYEFRKPLQRDENVTTRVRI